MLLDQISMKDKETKDCKRWWGYSHDWRKCWYSEYKGEPVMVNAQLYGTKKCYRCGMVSEGFAEKENWQPKYDNLNALRPNLNP